MHHSCKLQLFCFLFISLSLLCFPNWADAENDKTFEVEPFAEKPRVGVKWRVNLVREFPWGYRPRQHSSPTVIRLPGESHSLLFGLDTGELLRINTRNGEVEWSAELSGAIHADAAVVDKTGYIGTIGGDMYAVDLQDGEIEWTYSGKSPFPSRVGVDESNIYAMNGNDVVKAFRKKDGEELWSYSRKKPGSFTVKGAGTPLVGKESMYVGFSDGHLVSLDPETGEVQWERDLGAGTKEFFDVDEQPISLQGGDLIATSFSGGIYRLKASDGSTKWHSDIDNVASVTRIEHALYAAGADHRVYRVNLDDGSVEWKTDLGDDIPAHISSVGFYLFVTTTNGPIYVIDQQTGYPLLKWNVSQGASTKMTFGKKLGFLLTDSGVLYGFRVAY